MKKKKQLDLKQMTYYRIEKTGMKKPVSRIRMVKGKPVEQTYDQEVLQRIYYTYQDFQTLRLEKLGINLPIDNKGFTTISNYFLDFWGAVMGSTATSLYIHLTRYCYGDKDYCFPDLPTIALKMQITTTTLNKYMDILEQNGFIYRFWLQNPEENNNDCGIIYKVRRTIPILSKELVEKLPKPFQLMHDQYIEQIMEIAHIELASSYDYTNDFEKLREKGKLGKLPIDLSPAERAMYTKKKITTIMDQRSVADEKLWINVLTYIQQRISINSFKTWYADTFCVVREQELIIYAKNAFHRDWLSSRYRELIMEALVNESSLFENISFMACLDENE
ncbi:DnaA N-terminal domain-containing protein [Brevibacillus laterosporus]|uniref:DnaA N-terminal domain-containing protein n=1 Tax=Brevibacillus laterosporus TaxID=1465 RepID=UPI000CE40683|nr:DnaA N-terminal domain-containing protein [Brevibacillus laterosporus]MED1666969.1 DnaA N-terminal domain-containing protein [Brevibacillus laterosporus]MED1667903.1 DnaA N-terminal domain-containing protein [Brevibacillus laterosporus]MED1716821.1 DnaA N-terminal domain-containing protein [Brevibacillus laterosporus]PPA89903.1 replication initiation protein [Brevibacillus laterosporus]